MMILITSGDYVDNELKIEFGCIPPCLLPIGNRTLIEYQAEILRKYEDKCKIFVSLPEDYQLTDIEKSMFNDIEVIIIPVPANMTLSESVLYSLNIIYESYNDNENYLFYTVIL